ncbi:MAG: hypothetical protein QXS12_03990, partial [Candidatus Caldarchaeum sp.]
MSAKIALLTTAIVAIAVAASFLAIGPMLLTPQQRSGETVAVTWGLLGEVVHRLTGGTVEVYQILP